MKISKISIKKAKAQKDKSQSISPSSLSKEKVIQTKLNALFSIVCSNLLLRNPKINQATVQEFVRIFYPDLIGYLGRPNQDKNLKYEIYKRGKTWLLNHDVMVPESWGTTPTLTPKVLKGVGHKIRAKQIRSKSEEYKSVPIKKGTRKKISKEMDRILKKIEDTKKLGGDKPQKKLKLRIQIVSGGYPGLGKKR